MNNSKKGLGEINALGLFSFYPYRVVVVLLFLMLHNLKKL